MASEQIKPRVFVSSVMEEFIEFRQAAKRGIMNAGGEPVLIEDYPSIPSSSRNVCLDAVRSSDIYLAVVGERGGWKAPSGKLVVEEEYDEAKQLKKRALIFIQDIDHDEDAKGFIVKVSDYIQGEYRKKFKKSVELQLLVEDALRPLINNFDNPKVKESIMKDILNKEYKILNQTSLRFVLIPEREDQFIDPANLDSPDLEAQIIDTGTLATVGLFSRRLRKDVEIGLDKIAVIQTSDSHGQDGVDEVRLDLSSMGCLVIDINVSGRRKEDFSQGMSNMVILERDINDTLSKCFAFAREFFNAKDQFRRFDRMLYGTALGMVGYRPLVKEVPKGSVSANMFGDDVVSAFERPQIIIRSDLVNSAKEIERTLTMFRRRMKK